jgi:hypothetical protein
MAKQNAILSISTATPWHTALCGTFHKVLQWHTALCGTFHKVLQWHTALCGTFRRALQWHTALCGTFHKALQWHTALCGTFHKALQCSQTCIFCVNKHFIFCRSSIRSRCKVRQMAHESVKCYSGYQWEWKSNDNGKRSCGGGEIHSPSLTQFVTVIALGVCGTASL